MAIITIMDWDGIEVTYGSGGGGGFIGLDICGHEVSHGLTENTANLNYSNKEMGRSMKATIFW